MQPDLRSSYVEGLMAVPTVDPGELFRTVRWHGVTRLLTHGTPPRVDVRS
jgi:hypothetical protein